MMEMDGDEVRRKRVDKGDVSRWADRGNVRWVDKDGAKGKRVDRGDVRRGGGWMR